MSPDGRRCLVIIGPPCPMYTKSPCNREVHTISAEGDCRLLTEGEYDDGRIADNGTVALAHAHSERVDLWSPAGGRIGTADTRGSWPHFRCGDRGPLTTWDFIPGTDTLLFAGPQSGGEFPTTLIAVNPQGHRIWELPLPGGHPMSITLVGSTLLVAVPYEREKLEHRVSLSGQLLGMQKARLRPDEISGGGWSHPRAELIQVHAFQLLH